MLLGGPRQRLAGAIRLIHDDGVGQLKNAFLDALELIATTGQHEQQEEIDHPRDLMLRLTDTDGLNQNDVVTRRLAKQQ